MVRNVDRDLDDLDEDGVVAHPVNVDEDAPALALPPRHSCSHHLTRGFASLTFVLTTTLIT